MISAIYNNFQQIILRHSTTIERIRDVQLRSNTGYSADIREILKELFRDDVMQPVPSQKCRQQNFGVKSLLQKLGILDQVEVNSALIELFVEANKL